MPRKEKTNAKTWERERRNRMNLYFKGLADLLPPHQDGKNRNKVDILIQASKYIKDLTNRTEELFHAHAVDAHKEELNRLKKLVAQLYSRTQLLSTLLKDAGITVPAEPALEKISPLKWSNKINVEDAEKYLDRFKERKTEKRKSKSIAIKTPLKKKLKNGNVTTLTKKSAKNKEPTASINNRPAEDQENHVNSSSVKNKNGDGKSTDPNDEAELRTNSILVSDKETAKSTGPNLRSGVRKLQSRKKIKRKGTKTRDNVLLKEKLRKVTKQEQLQHTTQSQSITSLIPGTLILSGVSKIMPLVTPITSNIIVNGTTQSGNSIILGNTQANPMIVMQPLVNRIQNTTVVSVHNEIATMNAAAAAATSVQKVTLNTVPSIQTNVGLDSHDWVSNVKTIIDATKFGGRKGILPKGREITKTTMAYKVPIPAVHRDSKLNNRNVENNNDTNKATDIRGKIKKSKSVRNKKITTDESVDDSDDVKTIAENCGKKRKNIIDRNDNADAGITPMKISKKNLPETCESIENLRHVVEKIGDNTTQNGAIVISEKPKNINEEKYQVKATNTDVITESVELVASQSKLNEPTSDPNLKISSNAIQNLSPESMKREKACSLPGIKNVCVPMDISSKSRQASDAIVTNHSQLTITKSKDLLSPPTSTLTPTKTVSSLHQFPGLEKVITDSQGNMKNTKEISNIKTGFHNLLTTESCQQSLLDHPTIVENTKIILNLDTNTTTTMKPESNAITLSTTIGTSEIVSRNDEKDRERAPKNSLSYSIENSFIPIGSRTEALHSDLSNDLFASLQVPSSSHNPESISPTAAFLMAFPLVSSLNGKTEVLEEDMKEDLKYHSQTPPMLLQIGAIEPNSFKVKQSTNSDETKYTPGKMIKTELCQTVSIKAVAESSPKVLPKIVNTETFKERLYKVVPYTSPSEKLPESTSTSCSTNIPTSSTVVSEDRAKRMATKFDTTLCTTMTKYNDATSSLPTSTINGLPKYNANICYPSIPNYLPTYSTFTPTTSENQMLPLNNSTVSSYSTSLIPISPTYQVNSGAKDAPTLRHANLINPPPPPPPILPKEINSIDNLQSTITTERQEYQTRTSNGGLLPSPLPRAPPPPPLSSSSSQSLHYNYSSHPKDSCSIQIPQNNQRIYPENQNKNDPSCSMSTQSVNTSGTCAAHEKESVDQMSYQSFSIGQKAQSINVHDAISNNLIRTSSSSYTLPQTVDSLTTNLNNDKNISQNSYQNYLAIGQSKDSCSTTIPQQQQHNNSVQLQNLGQTYPTLVKQISSIDSFANIQQQQEQHRNYVTTRKHETFVSVNSTHQQIKSLSDSAIKSQNQPDSNSQQQIETLFQSKRNDTQTYAPYSREQKKMFGVNASDNPQITKSHVLNATLPPYQVQQQQTCVATSNYSQGNMTENVAKRTTTVANNSSNFSILSWTSFSPICGGSNSNTTTTTTTATTTTTTTTTATATTTTTTTTAATTTTSTTSTTTNNNSNNNNNNNNLVQFEPAAEHIDDTQEDKICDNFNYNTLHKDNIGYGNLVASESTFTADSTTITGTNVDKTKNKLNHKDGTTYDNTTSNKVKNSVQSSNTPQQQQQQQSQKSARTLSQNPNVNDNFKFNDNENNDDKDKSKFPMDSAYTQTEFTTMDQHARHQNVSKSHQTVTSKAGKTPTYAIAGFDSQVSFDIADTVTSTKCAADIYSGSNYKYPGNKEHSQIKYQPVVQSQPAIIQQDNSPYSSTKQNLSQQQNINNNINNNDNNNKVKPVIQQQTVRPPVNWMMTPEVKHNTNISDIILPPIGKELEFCPNNLFSQTPSYNQTTSNQFYNNYDAAVSSSHTFPNVASLQTDSRRIIDSFYTDDQQFSWSPTKNPPGAETMKTIEQQVVVPSTLPTLVGDLALGTNIPEKQNFLYNQMSSRPSNDLAKPTVKEKETNAASRDFQVMLNPQSVQHPSQGGSFLSVSQLVEHEKEKTHHHHQQNHHTHHHQPPLPPPPPPPPPQQQQKQQQQQQQLQQQTPQTQTRKPQRKAAANTSPRGGAKRQIEMRKQTRDQQLQPQQQQTQSQVQPQHSADQKVSSTHEFTDQTFQQSQQQQSVKYQQNDALWRNRNCKSNYTAEALIGVNNTSIQDTSNTDKQLHAPAIKFSEFPQNKFSTSLSSSDMVMPTINYLSNPDDGNGYSQIINQNFNHSSYTYSANSNIYPSTNFMASISNTPSSYPMMSLHDNPTDYLEANSFLLSNVGNVTSTNKTTATVTSSVTTRGSTSTITVPTNAKTNQQYGNNNIGKLQHCTDKRNSYSTVSKKSKRKPDATMNNLDFSISGVAAPIEDYHPHAPTHHHHHHHHHHPPPPPPAPPPPPHHHHHHHQHAHTTSFLATPHANTLYQNHMHNPTTSVGLSLNGNRTRGSSAVSSNSVAMAHHPSGTSLTNFNLSTIFPEINDKRVEQVTGYKASSAIVAGLSQSPNHSTLNYPQRANYTTNNTLGHVPQISESAQFTTSLPPPPASVLHYKAT